MYLFICKIYLLVEESYNKFTKLTSTEKQLRSAAEMEDVANWMWITMALNSMDWLVMAAVTDNWSMWNVIPNTAHRSDAIFSIARRLPTEADITRKQSRLKCNVKSVCTYILNHCRIWRQTWHCFAVSQLRCVASAKNMYFIYFVSFSIVWWLETYICIRWNRFTNSFVML